ncbi:MAG: trypsin-like peptidase domain-containing protein [Oscillospiraceae bacterium]|nr:trypsin-like peptidase domain-containing protein [Oscillospiraceae bacterium]
MNYDDWDARSESYEQYSYKPYGSGYNAPQKKKRKRHTGLLAVLVILALITGIVSWAVNFLDLTVEKEADSLTFSLGDGETMEAVAEYPEQQTQKMSPVKAQDAPKGSVDITDTPRSVENRPVEDAQALSLQQIYEKVSPSVASISCINAGGSGTGTGIVMSKDGYVITNYHVIDNAQQIYVLLGEHDRYEAELVGGDETTDLAVLKIEAQGLTPAQFGDSDVLRVGDAVVAIGDPLGTQLRGTMTDGIVSAINRDLNMSGRQMTLIQTNAALNSGNSGGPLINCYGQVIGINTMKMSGDHFSNATVEGLGFAIPITQAKPILDELISQGYVSGRPAIGIQGQTVDLRAQLFYHLPSGVLVTGILEDSDAFEKGLEENDVIVQFDGHDVSSLDELVTVKNGYEAGQSVRLTIYRGRNYYYADITLVDQITPDIY